MPVLAEAGKAFKCLTHYSAIGTEFIGKRDFGSDGAYVATEFKTAMLPLYPTRSVRVYRRKILD